MPDDGQVTKLDEEQNDDDSDPEPRKMEDDNEESIQRVTDDG